MFNANSLMGRALAVAIMVAAALVTSCRDDRVDAPRSVRGVLDARSWDFENRGPLELSGQWEFYWNRLITPAEFAGAAPAGGGFIDLPRPWNGARVAGAVPGEYGYATFRLVMLLPERSAGGRYAVRMPFTHTAYALWADGRLVSSNGSVGTSAETMRPFQLPRLSPLSGTAAGPDGSRVELVVQVSNFMQRTGGILQAVRVGVEERMVFERERALAISVFMAGILFIISILHLAIYFLRREDRVNLYFALLCIVVLLRILLTGEKLAVQVLPQIPWAVFLKLEYCTLTAGAVLIMAFLHAMYRDEIRSVVVRTVQVVSLAYTAFVLAAPARLSSQTLVVFQAVILMGSIYLLAGVVRAAVRRREGAILNLFGGSVLIITAVNDILASHQFVPSVYFVPLGLMALIIAQSVSALQRWVRDRDRLLFLNRELNIARRIQETIIPKKVPGLNGLDISAVFLPMHEVGGDVYDFIEIDDGQIGILVADVSGHGIPAALISSMVKTCSSMLLPLAAEPSQFLGEVNRILRRTIARQYITASYTCINVKERKLRHSRAGHEPMLVYRGSTSELIEVMPRGRIIGFDAENRIEQRTLDIFRGDRIIIYTDCLTEAFNSRHEMFGDKMFHEIVLKNAEMTCHELSAHLVGCLKEWIGKTGRFNDDLTLIIIDVC